MLKNLLFCALFFLPIIGHAQNTSIPDSNFEQRLIDMGYDMGPVDGIVPTANIDGITTLFVPNSNISDLTGIEDFVALTSLDCIGNPIISLDLSSNTALVSFFTGQNQLVDLNVSNNIALETLICSGTLLGSLDVSNNTNLKLLACPNSQLTNLDLKNNLQLTNLVASDNLFSSLDLSNNSVLETLVCTGSLNVSPLTNINVKNGNNAILTALNARFNDNLLCIQVDDEQAANTGMGAYGNWQVDGGVTYSEDCTNTLNLEKNDFNNNQVRLIPNPNSGSFQILYSGKEPILICHLFDITGKRIAKINIQELRDRQLNLNLSKGVYFLSLKTLNNSITKKMIIN